MAEDEEEKATASALLAIRRAVLQCASNGVPFAFSVQTNNPWPKAISLSSPTRASYVALQHSTASTEIDVCITQHPGGIQEAYVRFYLFSSLSQAALFILTDDQALLNNTSLTLLVLPLPSPPNEQPELCMPESPSAEGG